MEIGDEDDHVEATFDARSLRVVRALDGGREKSGALSPDDRAKIERTIRDDVLECARHPEIRFVSTRITPRGHARAIEGALSLHGVTRRIEIVATPREGLLVAEAELHQPDFGITPYTAAFGTLRVRPAVRVRIAVPVRDSSSAR